MDAKGPRTGPSPSPVPCGAVLLAILAAIFLIITLLVTGTGAAQASTWSPYQRDNAALNWAETQTGKPYVWGGTGPYGYDCSGLVYEAFLREGINIGRDTYEQLATWGNGHFKWIPWGQERRGDIAFYGSGHEEIVTYWRDTTFGAHTYGSPVGWATWGSWWHPTMFVRVE